MAEAAQHSTSTAPHSAKVVHHGRTTAAWTGSILATIAFVMGGIALVLPNWPLFWVSVGLLVVAVIAGKVLQSLGYGAN